MSAHTRSPSVVLLAASAWLAGCADHPIPTAATPDAPPRLATFAVPCEVGALRIAIAAANDEMAHPGPNTIELEPGCTYTFEEADHTEGGATALPAITSVLVVEGRGATIERAAGAPAFRFFRVTTGQLTLRDVTLHNGSGSPGGAIRVDSEAALELLRVRAIGNRSGTHGGALHVAGSATLGEVTVANNVAAGDGGGIHVTGALTLRASTLEGNRAGNDGGGLQLVTLRPALVENTTVSGNHASREGGGIGARDVSVSPLRVPFELRHLTVTGNESGSIGGGMSMISVYRSFEFRPANTIVTANTAHSGHPDVAGGAATSGGYNLIGVTPGHGSWAATDLLGVDAGLDDRLLDHGGGTRTHALLAGSVAIAAIPLGANGCGDAGATDQRGVARPQGGGCDIGAYERAAYGFSGFRGSVAAPPDWNRVNSGRTVPLRFSLGGFQGIEILAVGSPGSRPIECGSAAGIGPTQPIGTPGDSGLTYSPDADEYGINWQTEGGWSGSCRELVLTLDDGSVHTALFEFR